MDVESSLIDVDREYIILSDSETERSDMAELSWGMVVLLSEWMELEFWNAEPWISLTLVETEDTEIDNWWAISDSWLIEVKLSWRMDEKILSAESVVC